MNPLDQLKAVLCDPSGKCCIDGSDEDRAIVDRALQALAPPRKPWVGLTEDERFKIATEMGALNVDWIEFAFEIEKHVRLKNT
jgi:hypothetical protein